MQRFIVEPDGAVLIENKEVHGGVAELIGDEPLLRGVDVERFALWSERKQNMSIMCDVGTSQRSKLADMSKTGAVAGLHWFSMEAGHKPGESQMCFNIYDEHGHPRTFEMYFDDIERRFILREGSVTHGSVDNPAGVVELESKVVGLPE